MKKMVSLPFQAHKR